MFVSIYCHIAIHISIVRSHWSRIDNELWLPFTVEFSHSREWLALSWSLGNDRILLSHLLTSRVLFVVLA